MARAIARQPTDDLRALLRSDLRNQRGCLAAFPRLEQHYPLRWRSRRMLRKIGTSIITTVLLEPFDKAEAPHSTWTFPLLTLAPVPSRR